MQIVFTTLNKSCIFSAAYFGHSAKEEKSEYGVFTTGVKH